MLHPGIGSPAKEGHGAVRAGPEEAIRLKGLEKLSYKDGLMELGLCSQKRKLCGDLIAPFYYCKVTYKKKKDG